MVMDSFDEWWMLLSKVPYMDKKEIARLAWDASPKLTLSFELDCLRSTLRQVLVDAESQDVLSEWWTPMHIALNRVYKVGLIELAKNEGAT